MKQSIASLLCCFAIGCGGDDGHVTVEDEVAALCDLYRVVCERQAECGVYIYNRDTDPTVCQARLDCAGFAAAARGNDVAVSIDDANACRDALDAATCEALVPWVDHGEGTTARPTSFVAVDDACKNVMEGLRDEGETCAWTEQCGEDLACEGQTCPGTCVEHGDEECRTGTCGADSFCSAGSCATRAGPGESCFGVEYENACVDGYYCSIAAEFTCVAQIAAGQPCSDGSYFACAGGNVCAVDGTCRTPTPLGAECSYAYECGIAGYCDFSSATQTCRPTLAPGAACAMSWNECGADHTCRDGTCQSLAEINQERVTERSFVGQDEDCSNANCGAGLSCRPSGSTSAPTWRCEPAIALGQPCSVPGFELDLLFFHGVAACAEGVCDLFADTPTCVSPQPAGAACSPEGFTAACATLFCVDGTCIDPYDEVVCELAP
jgi:hypothetical protein